jgi:peptide/nickel transport system substrate-binding protein
VLRVGIAADYNVSDPPLPGDPTLDPSREYTAEGFEMLRCCLVRTLYQYSGRPTKDGGSELRPDLATAMPDVSPDGLTWTIHIRPGIHYAPPLANQEIVAADFVTALKRVAKVTQQDGGDYSVYYSAIQGFDDYVKGKADSISGVATPDTHTLVFTLTTRVGDFAYRLGLAATAPIPTAPTAPAAPLGVATGHDSDYGGFLVASGPYMLEGSASLNPGLPPKKQRPAPGFPSHTKIISLVRNPSWLPATDQLRDAYPDRIEIHLVPSLEDIQKQVDSGTLDLMMYNGPLFTIPLDQFRRYRADPALGQALVYPKSSARYLTMNLAVPPFDDVHVRRAANYIVDKTAFIGALGGLAGEPTTHVIPDALEDDQLVGYDPYRTSSRVDALAKAEAEMRLSKYDRNHDGICDAAACVGIKARDFDVNVAVAIKASHLIASELASIGIRLDLKDEDTGHFFADITTPTLKVGVGIAPGWSSDFLNASNFITPLFAGPGISVAFTVPNAPFGQCCNYSLVSQSSAALKRWGYSVTHVPNADDRINACLHLVGRPQLECWTAFDQYLTQNVVPWVPLMDENTVEVVPSRVLNYTYDEFTGLPSLAEIAIRAMPSPSTS